MSDIEDVDEPVDSEEQDESLEDSYEQEAEEYAEEQQQLQQQQSQAQPQATAEPLPDEDDVNASETANDDDVAGGDTAEQAGKAEEGPSPDDLTKRYLRLLNSGKLASKKKFESRDNSLRRSFRTTLPEDPDGDAALRTVFENELMRLRASAASLEVVPLQIRTTSARGSRPSTADSSGLQPQPRSSSARRGTGGEFSPRKGAVSPTQTMREREAECREGNRLPAAQLLGPTTLSPPPFKKLYTPGPGSYSPATDRFGGREGSAFGFGTARQRPPHVCIHDDVVSPGPAYLPSRDGLSSSTSPVRLKFSRQHIGTRFDSNAEQPSNCPHWNPGPGDYETSSYYKGGKLDAGVDAPKAVFGNSAKMVSPQTRFPATVWLSMTHARHENCGVHSPGPAAYSPSLAPVSQAPAQYSLGAKAASYFDAFLDPTRQPSPGPVYNTGGMNMRGSKSWGDDPKATFGRSSKQWNPEANLSAAPFISEAHAKVANASVHSPGPVYVPKKARHVPTPALNSGQPDRFYNRFEPGRIQ